MTGHSKLVLITIVALCLAMSSARHAIAQTVRDRADTSSLRPVRAQDGSTLAGVVRDSTGQPLHDARLTVSGVIGEWRSDSKGEFVVRGIPSGPRVVSFRVLGFAIESRPVEFAARDSTHLILSMSRLITRLGTVTIREREHLDALKSELDQRRRAGFGYRSDSLELARLPGVREAFNFPGLRTNGTPANWGIAMTGQRSLSKMELSCSPTIWVDGVISDQRYLNVLRKEEIALIEVYNSAARAPLQYGGTRTNCGVVLVWRKRYISP